MILTIGSHRAQQGSIAAALLEGSERAAEARGRADAAWPAGEDPNLDLDATVAALERTRLLNLARAAEGYIGPAIDADTLETARDYAGQYDVDDVAREGLVRIALNYGVEESVARRSVAAGLMRGQRVHDVEPEIKHQSELYARKLAARAGRTVRVEPTTAA